MNGTKLSVQEIRDGFTVRESRESVPVERDPDKLIVSGIPWHPYALTTWYALHRQGDGWVNRCYDCLDETPKPLEEALMDLAVFVHGRLA